MVLNILWRHNTWQVDADGKMRVNTGLTGKQVMATGGFAAPLTTDNESGEDTLGVDSSPFTPLVGTALVQHSDGVTVSGTAVFHATPHSWIRLHQWVAYFD